MPGPAGRPGGRAVVPQPLSRSLAAGLTAIGVKTRPSQVEFAIRDYLGAYGQIASEGTKLAAGEQKRSGLPQDLAPGAGAFVRRFVRGDTGATLERAQEDRLSETARAVLDDAGMADFVPSPVSAKIGDRTLTRDQQARVQLLTNAAVDAAGRWRPRPAGGAPRGCGGGWGTGGGSVVARNRGPVRGHDGTWTLPPRRGHRAL